MVDDAKEIEPTFLFRARLHLRIVALFIFAFAVSPIVLAQEVVDDELAPPPLRLLSQDEKTRLAAETEVKRRTNLALLMMDARLTKSAQLATQQEFDLMFVELGGFHGLMDNMLAYLDKSDKDSRKVLNNFKRFEIGLRSFSPRLELIRRDLPVSHEHYLKTLLKNLRAARARAIEPLFDDSVVPAKRPG